MSRKRYSAFTLIEMLVVMIILVVIGALSFAAYQDMQITIRLNEYSSVLEENIRRVQREAMLLNREPGEGWIYGLGIDYSGINGGGFKGEYKVFKWCASEMDYGSPRTTSPIPGYDSNKDYGERNGALPEYSSDTTIKCDGNEELKTLSGYDIGLLPPAGRIEVTKDSALGGIGDSFIGFILFESVTGRAFFYDVHGDLIWKTDPRGEPVSSPNILPLKISILPSGRRNKKIIEILPFSGKVTVKGDVK